MAAKGVEPLGLFDLVIGSTGNPDLEGAEKLATIVNFRRGGVRQRNRSSEASVWRAVIKLTWWSLPKALSEVTASPERSSPPSSCLPTSPQKWKSPSLQTRRSLSKGRSCRGE